MREWLLAVVAGTLVLGLVVAAVAPAGMRSTRNGDYAPQAENLRAGRGFVDESGQVLHRYPPAYPVVLWGLERLSGGTGLPLYGVLAGLAALCNGATAGLVWGLGRALGLSVRQAAVGAAAFAVHPFVLYGILLPLSETPFMTVMCGSALAVLRGIRQREFGRLALGGALAGLACLFRPIALLAPAVLGLAAAWSLRGSVVRRAFAGLLVVEGLWWCCCLGWGGSGPGRGSG